MTGFGSGRARSQKTWDRCVHLLSADAAQLVSKKGLRSYLLSRTRPNMLEDKSLAIHEVIRPPFEGD